MTQPPEQPTHIRMRGKLVHPDGKEENVYIRMSIGPGPLSVAYEILRPDYPSQCFNCGRDITKRGDGSYTCPFCKFKGGSVR